MISKGWQKSDLRSDVEVIAGQHILNEHYTEEPSGVPYLTGPIDFPNGKIFPSKYTLHPKSMCAAGDILITVKGSGTGKVTIADQPYCISRQLMALRPRTWDRDFLFAFISSRLACYQQEAAGLIPGLTKDQILDTALCVPPPSEQKRIAAILNSVDEAIEKTRAVIDQTRRLKTALLQDLFTHGLPGKHGRTKVEKRLGEIPTDWPTHYLGEVAAITKLAGFEYTSSIKYCDDGEVIALRALNIKSRQLDLTDIQRISKSASDSLPRSQLHRGDVVITYIGANIGDVLKIQEGNRFHLAPNVAKITCHKGLDPDYLVALLSRTEWRHQMASLTATTATPSLTMGQIRKIRVPLPEITEQRKIADVDLANEYQLHTQECVLSELMKTKSALSQALLSGQVRVRT